MTEQSPRTIARRTAVAILVIVLFALILLTLWFGRNLLLLLFAGILAATLLDGLADWVASHTPLSRKSALIVSLIAIILLMLFSGWLAAPNLAKQAAELRGSLEDSIQQIGDRIGQFELGSQLMQQLPNLQQLFSSRSDVMSQITGVVATTFDIITNFVLLVFFAIYFAFQPDLYTAGAIKLVPIHFRPRAQEVLTQASKALRWWLIGRLLSMLLVGVLSFFGLWLLGVPLAFLLGLLAGLLAFVPVVGPIVAVVPPALIALTQSTQLALYVIILYLAIQFLESYIITPLIQQRTVSLPPVLTIASQVFFGFLFGPLGVALANPLTVVLLVLVKMLYIEDMLGDDSVSPLA